MLFFLLVIQKTIDEKPQPSKEKKNSLLHNLRPPCPRPTPYQTTKRTGWVRRGVPQPESVADHSFRVALFALVASSSSSQSSSSFSSSPTAAAATTEPTPPRPPAFDASRAVKIALVHDLAEAIVGDIAPGDNVPKEEKARREAEAMAEMRRMLEGCSGGGSGGNSSKSNNVTIGAEVESLFEEYERGETPEAQLVKDCDKLEMLLQAVEYEKGADNPPLDLSEFFESVRGRLKTEVGRSWGAEIEGRRPTKRGCL